MKFSSAVTLLLSSLSLFAKGQENPRECVAVAEFDSSKDYFPEKSSVEMAEQFSIVYGNNYKIATNLHAGKSYLLYQCGTEIPSTLDQSSYEAVIPIPLTTFGLHYSTFVPFAELLGLRETQTAQAGYDDYFFSPCFNELIDTQQVALIADLNNATQVEAAGVSKDVPFFMGVGSSSVFDTNIEISEYLDKTNLAVFEWIKFFGVFFNREKEANEVFEASKERYECATENAQLLSADKAPTKIVWASYSTWGSGGFYSANACPNYYCELALACGAELLIRDGPMNITEFVDFAKDADVWLYSSTNFETVLNDFADDLSELKAVQNNELYDIMGHGEDAWFNERKVEPDALLEDFCHIVGSGNPMAPHVPTFFRQVDNPENSPGECNNLGSPYKHLGTFCVPMALENPPAVVVDKESEDMSSMEKDSHDDHGSHDHDSKDHDGHHSHDESAAVARAATGTAAVLAAAVLLA